MDKVVKEKKSLNPVDLIERIPSENIDLDCLASFCRDQLASIRSDRKEWETRRRYYLDIIDNLLEFEAGRPPFEGASTLHIPIIMEKVRATQARLFQALFALNPPFFIEPQEALDTLRITRIYNLMKWALTRFVNYYVGIEDVMDEALWDFASEGWCFLQLRWERKFRKAIVVEEIKEKQKGRPASLKVSEKANPEINPKLKFKEVEKFVKVFEGPVLENIAKENIYLPGAYTIQTAPFVGIEMTMSASDLLMGVEMGIYEEKAVDKVVEHIESSYNPHNSHATDIRHQKGYNQGVEIQSREATGKDADRQNTEKTIIQAYVTFDVDKDMFDEELMVWYHEPTNSIIRWTYLDRITKSGRRPIYKADYIKRPGRPYAIGLAELLYNLNIEIDVIHNQKVDFGTISNMPFFFYDSTSSLDNQTLKLIPGQGTPVSSVSGILFPQLKSGTQFGFQEENLLLNIISRVSGISDLNLGIAPTPGDAVRSQGQMAALLNEGNAQLDMSLRRVQRMMSDIFADIHQMLVDKLPKEFQHLVIGESNNIMLDPATQLPVMQEFKDTRQEIAGRVHFNIKANSASGNKPLLRQSRTVLLQQLLNPINLQMGIVTLNNVYELNKALLEVSDEIDINRFITKPENAPRPLPLEQEIETLRQGLLPEIPLNDNHQMKIQALTFWMNSPEVQEAVRINNINPKALQQTVIAIGLHNQMLQMIQAQTQMLQNQTGSQVPQAPSVGLNPGGAPAQTMMPPTGGSNETNNQGAV